jgi:hypothetical protein
MKISKRRAICLGASSIAIAICVQLFNDFACYKKGILETIAFLWFPAIPLVPAIISLKSNNPLRAITASLCVIPFYWLAYYVDCVQPYQGGGASMIYVAVIFYGTPLAVLGAFITGPICRVLKIEITAVNNRLDSRPG